MPQRKVAALLDLADCAFTKLFLARPECFLFCSDFLVMPNPGYVDVAALRTFFSELGEDVEKIDVEKMITEAKQGRDAGKPDAAPARASSNKPRPISRRCVKMPSSISSWCNRWKWRWPGGGATSSSSSAATGDAASATSAVSSPSFSRRKS